MTFGFSTISADFWRTNAFGVRALLFSKLSSGSHAGRDVGGSNRNLERCDLVHLQPIAADRRRGDHGGRNPRNGNHDRRTGRKPRGAFVHSEGVLKR